MSILTKRSYDERLFEVNLGPAIRDTDTIRDVVAVVTDGDVTISDISHTTGVVTFLASGGDPGSRHKITIHFTTASNPVQALEAVVDLEIVPDSC